MLGRCNLDLSNTSEEIGNQRALEWAFEKVAADTSMGVNLLKIKGIELEEKVEVSFAK